MSTKPAEKSYEDLSFNLCFLCITAAIVVSSKVVFRILRNVLQSKSILFPMESQFVKVAMAAQNENVAGPVSAKLSIIFDLCGYV